MREWLGMKPEDFDTDLLAPDLTLFDGDDTYGGLVIDPKRCAYCASYAGEPCALHRDRPPGDDPCGTGDLTELLAADDA